MTEQQATAPKKADWNTIGGVLMFLALVVLGVLIVGGVLTDDGSDPGPPDPIPADVHAELVKRYGYEDVELRREIEWIQNGARGRYIHHDFLVFDGRDTRCTLSYGFAGAGKDAYAIPVLQCEAGSWIPERLDREREASAPDTASS